MDRVLLVCQGGMSSSFIVKNMRSVFKKYNEEIYIQAVAGMELVDYIEQADIVLIVPNILYMWDDIETVCKDHGIDPVIIPAEYYGNMDAESIRDLIISLKQK